MESERKVALIVATRNRPELLPDLMKSIAHQTITAKQIIIVDSSDSDFRLTTDSLQALNAIVTPVEIIYIHTDVKSLPAQRNIGIEALDRPSFEFVLFLDDDTRPETKYMEKLIATLDADANSIGSSGVTGPPPPQIKGIKKFLRVLFRLYTDKGGVVLRSGINFPIRNYDQGPTRSQWIFGCSLWKTQVFDTLKYPEQLPGGALYEDAIFSYSANRIGNLWVDPGAYLQHLLSNSGRPDSELDGIRKVRNRYELIRSMRPRSLSTLAFWWSLVGQSILLMRHSLPWFLGNGRQENKVVAELMKGHIKGMVLVLLRKEPL